MEPRQARLPGRLRGGQPGVEEDHRRQGQSFTAGKLGSFTVGADNSILLGPPQVFDKANIDQFNF